MPAAVRAGPFFVLGQTLLRMREFDEAALALLRIPILFPGEHELSADALLAAARALQQQQQLEEAAGLYREVVARFADTPAKGEAERQLQQLEPSGR